MSGDLPLANRIVVLSGPRPASNLVQKGHPCRGEASSPPSGAPLKPSGVNLAVTSGLTLVGFLREAHCKRGIHTLSD